MKKLIYFILIIGLVGIVNAKYIDPSYVFVSSYTTGSNFNKIRIDKSFSASDIRDYIHIEDVAVGSSTVTWNGAVINGFVIYQGGATSTNTILRRCNKTDYNCWQLLNTSSTENNRGRGVAIINNYIYTVASASGNLMKRVGNGSEIWNLDVSDCISGVNRPDRLYSDGNNLWLMCGGVTTGFNIINNSGSLIYANNITWDGVSGFPSIQYYDMDSTFLFVFFENDTRSFIGKAYKDNPNTIIDYQQVTNWSVNGGQVEVINEYVYVIVANITNDKIEIYKLDKQLNIVKNVTLGSNIDDIEVTANDINYLYVGTDGADTVSGGLFVIDTDLNLIKHIYSDIIYSVTTSSYRGGSGTGLGYYNLSYVGKVDGQNVSVDDVLCTLNYDNEGTWVEAGSYATNENGFINVYNLQPDNYQLNCELDNGKYPNIVSDFTSYIQTEEFEILNSNMDIVMNWYTVNDPHAYKNVTIYTFDLATNKDLDSSYIQVFRSGTRIATGITGLDGEKLFSLPACIVDFNITHDNYEPKYIYSYMNDVNNQVIFVGMIKDYSLESSECYVDGYITEGGSLRNSSVYVSCSVNGIEKYSTYGKVLNGFYNITSIPNSFTCSIFYNTLNDEETEFMIWKPDSKQDSQYNGMCDYCKCHFNSTFAYNTRHYFKVWYGDVLIQDVGLNLYNSSGFQQAVFKDRNSLSYYSDGVINGVEHTLMIISDYLEDYNYTFTASDSETIHNIYLNKDGEDCLYRFTFESDARYSYDTNITKLDLTFQVYDSRKDKLYTKQVSELDESYFSGNVPEYQIFLDCRNIHKISITSKYFDLADYQADTFTMDGHNSFEPKVIRLNTKQNYNWDATLRTINYWGIRLLIPFLLLVVIVIFLFLLVMIGALLNRGSEE